MKILDSKKREYFIDNFLFSHFFCPQLRVLIRYKICSIPHGDTIIVSRARDYEYYMDSEEEPSFEDEYVNSEEIYRRTHSWIDFHKLDISLENRHFFLDGHYLDIFIKFILKNARRTIIVVNPFIDLSTPAQLLIEAKQQGKTVVLVTRPHSTQRAKDVHKTLANSRISILYHENLHAKIIMIDDSLAIITSMNFIQRATAGVSWEAGLVTIDKWVVGKVKESITDLNLDSAKI